MSSILMRRSLALTAIVLGLVLQAGNARASAFRVSPIQVQLSGKASALLTLTNESPDTLRFQISAFTWSQSPAGEIQLGPTEDIAFFPALLSLKPGEERKVRVGSNVSAADVEKTYRIFFEELPPEEKPEGASQVRILTKMGIPIFVQPTRSAPQPSVSDVAVTGGRLAFDVMNRGNAHFSVLKVHVTGTGAADEKVWEHDLDGWYVLANSARKYLVDVPAEACAKLRSVKVEAVTDLSMPQAAATPTAEATVSANSCR